MSYCRFSDDDFNSDVYAYESDDGYCLSVAKFKRVFSEPLPDRVDISHNDMTEEDINAYLNRHHAFMEIVDRTPLVEIELPHAGEDFIFSTPNELYVFLAELESFGYRVPDYAFNLLLLEISNN